MHERLVTMMALALIAIAASQAGTGHAVAAGVAVVAVGMLLGAGCVRVVIRSRRMTIGDRARQHSESLDAVAAPRHPSTPGRPQSRAPSKAFSAA